MARNNEPVRRRSPGSLGWRRPALLIAPAILAMTGLFYAFASSPANASSASVALHGGTLAPVSVGVGQSVTFVNPTDLVPIAAEVGGVTVTGTVVFSATLTFADRPGGLIAPGESVTLAFETAGSSTYSYSYGFDIVGIDAANVGVPLDDAYSALTPIAAALPLPTGGAGSVSALAPSASVTSASAVPSAVPSAEVDVVQPQQPPSLSVGDSRASGPTGTTTATAPTAGPTSAAPSSPVASAGPSSPVVGAAAPGSPRGAAAGAGAAAGVSTSQQPRQSAVQEADSNAEVAAAAGSTESASTGPIAILAIVLLAGVSMTLLRFYILARGD